MEKIVVPFRSSIEFREPMAPAPLNPVMPAQLVSGPSQENDGQYWQQRAMAAEHRADKAISTVRTALLPEMARWMMNKLVQALYSQRADLLNTQAQTTEQITVLEQRLTHVQDLFQARMKAYQERIAELENQLMEKDRENHQLMREKFIIAKKALETEEEKAANRVDLRGAGFLLRA